MATFRKRGPYQWQARVRKKADLVAVFKVQMRIPSSLIVAFAE